MPKCPECGALYGTGDDFCPDCGRKLGESSTVAKTDSRSKAIELKENEQPLIDVNANLSRGMTAVGGRLKITTNRLIFEPHALYIHEQTLEVPLNQIQEAKPRKNLGIIPNGILIKLVSGQEYRFVVWKRNEIIELINKKRGAK